MSVERMKGVEPSCPAWEDGVLPMNYTRILICIDDTTLSALFPVFVKSYLEKHLVKSPATKRSCEEMNPHFFTAPFYFAFIWFRVHGSWFMVLVAASPPFLEDGILVSQPSPLGEGARKGRIG